MKHLFSLSFIILTFIRTAFCQPLCQFAYIPNTTGSFNYNVTLATADGYGNFIYAGKINNRADMDPGVNAADTSFSSAGTNYFISKVSSDGHLKWIKYFKVTSNINFFEFTGLRLNSNNEIIVTGNYYGLVNFNLTPPGVDTLRSHQFSYPDYFVAKYDSSGNHLWVFSIGAPGNTNMNSMAMTMDRNNRIILSVNRNVGGMVDLDPSAAVHNSISASANIVCYDNAGNYVWNNAIGQATSYAVQDKSIEMDSLGNCYLLSVGYYELTVTKFNAAGTRLWDKKIGNFSALARVNPLSVISEKNGSSFYVAGTYGGTVDFDPGVAIVNSTASSTSYQDGFIAKYDSAMNLLWLKNCAGNAEFGKYSLDYSGSDIIASGKLKGSINFGNGIVLSSAASYGAFYIKLNASGTVLNGYVLNGGNSIYNTINSTSAQSFIATGSINGTLDMDPTAAVKNITSGSSTNFIASYGAYIPSVSTLNIKLYLEGYYTGAGMMRPVLNSQGQSLCNTCTDSVIVELRNANAPYLLAASSIFMLNTNGTMTCTFSPALSGSYYIAIKTRNHLTTWSKLPVTIGASPVSYDF